METILNKNKEGYGYCYTDLSEIHRYLESIGTKYIQYIERIDNDDYIMTVPIMDGKKQEPIRGCRVVQATLSGVKNPAQEQGSALTYARRYSLLMAFGLATDDDDAQSLSEYIEPTKEDAEKYVLQFGKYKGKKLTELDNNYFDWLKNNTTDEYVKKCINLLIPDDEKTKLELRSKFIELVQNKGIDYSEIFDKYGVENSKELSIEQLQKIIKELEK